MIDNAAIALAQQKSRARGFKSGQIAAVPSESGQIDIKIEKIKGSSIFASIVGGKKQIVSIEDVFFPDILDHILSTGEQLQYDLLLAPQVCEDCGRRMCDHEVGYKKELRLRKS